MELKQFILAINQICEEKGISREKAMEIVEAALAAAYKKDYGKKGQIIKVNFDEKTGELGVFQVKTVAEKTEEDDEGMEGSIEEEKNVKEEHVSETDEKSETAKKKFNPERNLTVEEATEYLDDPKIGDEVKIPLESHNEFGRIAAQTAKQVMIQKIREAEKDAIYDEFRDKEGEVVNGIVQRIERRNVFVDIGKAVGVLFPSEQVEHEHYRIGQRLKVYIMKVDKESKEANLVLSRTSPNIIRKMFELEVPEIAAKTVEIKSIAREAGSRTKVAVCSNEEGIDPIGSCVGQRGSRIQTIINELGGEKIDIIEWNKDVRKYIQNSLSPAKVSRIDANETNKSAIAYVSEDQLSLAIGKQGQNVRLAAKLTGWKIDVLAETESGAAEVAAEAAKAAEGKKEAETQEEGTNEAAVVEATEKGEAKKEKKKKEKKAKTEKGKSKKKKKE